jgi:Flp pilus assembly CpaF family ATPase
MRPERLVVGEVRQQEWLDLLIALNSSSRDVLHPRQLGSRRR